MSSWRVSSACRNFDPESRSPDQHLKSPVGETELMVIDLFVLLLFSIDNIKVDATLFIIIRFLRCFYYNTSSRITSSSAVIDLLLALARFRSLACSRSSSILTCLTGFLTTTSYYTVNILSSIICLYLWITRLVPLILLLLAVVGYM